MPQTLNETFTVSFIRFFLQKSNHESVRKNKKRRVRERERESLKEYPSAPNYTFAATKKMKIEALNLCFRF